MITIVYDPAVEKPNSWAIFRYASGLMQVVTRCANGHIGSLADHQIGEDGTVSPSVVCQKPGCDFHEFIKLEGWKGKGE